MIRGPSWSWSYGSWIYNYLCNQCLSSLMLWVRIPIWWGIPDATLWDKVCWWLATGQWFSLGTRVSSTNKTNCHDITEILLKVALNPQGMIMAIVMLLLKGKEWVWLLSYYCWMASYEYGFCHLLLLKGKLWVWLLSLCCWKASYEYGFCHCVVERQATSMAFFIVLLLKGKVWVWLLSSCYCCHMPPVSCISDIFT
jgi:hypothetical protein